MNRERRCRAWRSVRCCGAVLLVVTVFVWHPPTVCACVVAPPDLRWFVDSAQIVAIGTLTEADPDTVLLRVDEYLTGPSRERILRINNHTFTTDSACTPVVGPGHRFRSSQRVVALLEPDATGTRAEWKPVGLLAEGIYRIDGHQLQLISERQVGSSIVTIADARRAIADAHAHTWSIRVLTLVTMLVVVLVVLWLGRDLRRFRAG